MGRPAFWGVAPGDRSTEVYKYPSTTGTAHGGASTSIVPAKDLLPQKVLTQFLAGP